MKKIFLLVLLSFLTGCGGDAQIGNSANFCVDGTLYNYDSSTPVYAKSSDGIYYAEKCVSP